ncbi:hypothetical protein SUBVAR_04263 [Subdoligranulum variabile DSM 15176]|uniref:Uncharacterized protein n=1 Tax=Subdoligranulum variabile DSM 15176 TaxID=411471 RepID=D1PIU7_9FIRM|nr:hypothetical protein SUBVAR_04263 [Subdoligranulum variabile DSM 15176]
MGDTLLYINFLTPPLSYHPIRNFSSFLYIFSKFLSVVKWQVSLYRVHIFTFYHSTVVINV